MIVSKPSLYSFIYNQVQSVRKVDCYLQNIRKYQIRGKITQGENMPRKILILNITSSEKEELEKIINHENSSNRLVLRCRIILLTQNGVPLKEIAQVLGLSRVTVNTWRQIYLAHGIEGLKVKKRHGRPSKLAKEILYRHFPGLSDNYSLSLKKVLNIKSRSTHVSNKITTILGVITYSMLFYSHV